MLRASITSPTAASSTWRAGARAWAGEAAGRGVAEAVALSSGGAEVGAASGGVEVGAVVGEVRGTICAMVSEEPPPQAPIRTSAPSIAAKAPEVRAPRTR